MTVNEARDERRQPDNAARMAGMALAAAALATAVAVAGRVAADADQPTFAESLAAIANSWQLYAVGGAGRFLSGVALMAAAWALLQTWIIREKRASAVVPILLGVSGAITLASGVCAVALAVVFAPDVDGASETVNFARRFAGKLGFAVAGLALIIAARYQWTVGGQLRIVAPFSALAGVAMQFIWVDSATVLHPIIGTAFFIWLLIVGVTLATGRTERLFIRLLAAADEGGARRGGEN